MQFPSVLLRFGLLRGLRALAVLSVVLPSLSFGAPGELKPGFGSYGTVIANVGFYVGPFDINALAHQPDGKLVVAGQCDTQSGKAGCLVRLLPNGEIDTAFGQSGAIIWENEFAMSSFSGLFTDGTRIVVGGTCRPSSLDAMCIARFLDNGAPDPAFANAGRLVLHVSGSATQGNALAIDAMGRYLVAGSCQQSGSVDFCVVRLNTAGAMDASFGTGGVASLGVGTGDDAVNALAFSGSKILLGGTCHNGIQNKICVVRINENGGLDTTFGTGGMTFLDFGVSQDSAQSLIVHLGRIYVSGLCTSPALGARGCAARLLDTGAIDTAFQE